MNTAQQLKTNSGRSNSSWAEVLLDRGYVTNDDVRTLSETTFPLGLASEADAEALIRIERHVLDKASTWSSFFIRSLVDFTIWGERPTGRITEARARWLMDRLDRLSIGSGDRLLTALRDETEIMPTWFRFAIHHRLGTGQASIRRHTMSVWLDAA